MRTRGEPVLRAISLCVILFAAWLLLSGHYDPLLLTFGVVSSLLSALIAWRMRVIDREGLPVQLAVRMALYLPWLMGEIVKSNIQTARIIIDPALPIEPNMVRTKALQRSELGQVIYANSITLTPGTISVDLEASHIDVHCLSKAFADDIVSDEMNRRSAWVEGGR